MANERITDLPTVTNASLSDIFYAVQGYVSPSSPGLSVQETGQQLADLFLSNSILFNAGNPNGSVAGKTYQLCWDTTNTILYVCTTTGSSTTAVWTKSITLTAGSGITIAQGGNTITISTSGSAMTWNEVVGTSASMTTNNGYVSNNAGLVTLTLPTTASFGDTLEIIGKGAGGWIIAQGASQQIVVGNASSTAGAGGSVASTNRRDSTQLVCTTANTVWTVRGAPQSAGLTIV
jgi:hypothetical protein